MASYPIIPPNPSSGFHLYSLYISQGKIVINPYKNVNISNSGSRRGRRSSVLRASQSAGGGSAADPNPVGSGSSGGATPAANGGFSLSNIPPWSGWIFGSFFFSAIPIYRKIKMAEEKAEKTLASIAKAVEKAAEETDKVAEELKNSLPEGQLKDVAVKLEKIAEAVDREAEAAGKLIEKVDEMTDKLDEIVEPIVERELKATSKKAKTKS